MCHGGDNLTVSFKLCSTQNAKLLLICSNEACFGRNQTTVAHCKIHKNYLAQRGEPFVAARQTWTQLPLAETVRILGKRIVDSHGDIIALDPEIFSLVSQHLEFSGDCNIRSKCLSGA